MWQLILMAREGDRQAIEELFFSTFRSSYLIVFTLTGDRKKALDLLCESYIELFQNLETLENGTGFEEQLCRYLLARAKELETKPLRFSPMLTSSADSFRLEDSVIYDFNTLPNLDITDSADSILAVFAALTVEQQLCAYLFYYMDFDPSLIASILDIDEKTVCGILYDVRRTALPKIETEIRKSDIFRGILPESTILWALRNTAKYSLSEQELSAYYIDVTQKLMDTDIIDTTMNDGEIRPLEDSELQNFKPLKEGHALKRIFNLRTLVIFLFVLIIVGSFVGLKQLREYNRRKNERDSLTNRTTLSMSTTAFHPEQFIYSTEYDSTQEDTTSKEIETEEITTEEATQKPSEHTPGEVTTASPGSEFSFTENMGNITITGYNGTRSSIEVPGKINGKNVTAIGESAFFSSVISSIRLPSTLRTIEKNAFHSCTSLQSISLPSGVTTIGADAFRGCSSLRTIALSDSLQRIDAQAFYKCTALSSLTLPSSVTYLGDWAFAYCTNLTDFAIPGGVKYVGKSLFYECKSLQRCSIETSTKITSLGDSMFFDCTSLTSFHVPTTVKTIPSNCFVGCRSLTSVSIPSGITAIGTSAFADCISLSAIRLSAGLLRIEKSAFNGCMSLKEVIIPAGTLSIGEAAFSGCTNLRSANIPSSVTQIGLRAFSDCDDLVITCAEDSAAAKYADANNIPIHGRSNDNT